MFLQEQCEEVQHQLRDFQLQLENGRSMPPPVLSINSAMVANEFANCSFLQMKSD